MTPIPSAMHNSCNGPSYWSRSSRLSSGCMTVKRGSRRSAATRSASASRRSEEHTSELQSLMRISYAVFCLKKKKQNKRDHNRQRHTYNIEHTCIYHTQNIT